MVKSEADIENSWNYAQEGGQRWQGKVIIEASWVRITLLGSRRWTALRSHRSRASGQGLSRILATTTMSEAALVDAQKIAGAVTGALEDTGFFGVELFVKGDTVYFSEVSPRPTGMVTMISPQFSLHARLFWDCQYRRFANSVPASAVILVEVNRKKWLSETWVKP